MISLNAFRITETPENNHNLPAIANNSAFHIHHSEFLRTFAAHYRTLGPQFFETMGPESRESRSPASLSPIPHLQFYIPTK